MIIKNKVIVDLSGADLTQINLSGVDLSGADLSGADLSGTILARANLTRANLAGANLNGANLTRTYLNGTNLSRADLSGADLSGAYLSEVNLFKANLTNIKNFWNSHYIISEILKREAGNSISRRKIAGLILISIDWCWNDFLKIDDPEKEWALDVLRKFDPYMPQILKD